MPRLPLLRGAGHGPFEGTPWGDIWTSASYCLSSPVAYVNGIGTTGLRVTALISSLSIGLPRCR